MRLRRFERSSRGISSTSDLSSATTVGDRVGDTSLLAGLGVSWALVSWGSGSSFVSLDFALGPSFVSSFWDEGSGLVTFAFPCS